MRIDRNGGAIKYAVFGSVEYGTDAWVCFKLKGHIVLERDEKTISAKIFGNVLSPHAVDRGW